MRKRKITIGELPPDHPLFDGQWRRSITAFHPTRKRSPSEPNNLPRLPADALKRFQELLEAGSLTPREAVLVKVLLSGHSPTSESGSTSSEERDDKPKAPKQSARRGKEELPPVSDLALLLSADYPDLTPEEAQAELDRW